jgi:hypothetical protein
VGPHKGRRSFEKVEWIGSVEFKEARDRKLGDPTGGHRTWQYEERRNNRNCTGGERKSSGHKSR